VSVYSATASTTSILNAPQIARDAGIKRYRCDELSKVPIYGYGKVNGGTACEDNVYANYSMHIDQKGRSQLPVGYNYVLNQYIIPKPNMKVAKSSKISVKITRYRAIPTNTVPNE
jgi:hypothetical protein